MINVTQATGVEIKVLFGQTDFFIKNETKKLIFNSNHDQEYVIELKDCNSIAFNKLKNYLEKHSDPRVLRSFKTKSTTTKGSTIYPMEIVIDGYSQTVNAESKVGVSYFKMRNEFKKASLATRLICKNKSRLKDFLTKAINKETKKK